MVTKKKQKSAPHTFWWQSLFNLIAQGILSDAKAFIQSAEDQFKEFIQITIVRSILLFSCLIGYIFILIGVSHIMDSFFRLPGAGSLFVGSFILISSFIIFSLVGSQKKQ